MRKLVQLDQACGRKVVSKDPHSSDRTVPMWLSCVRKKVGTRHLDLDNYRVLFLPNATEANRIGNLPAV